MAVYAAAVNRLTTAGVPGAAWRLVSARPVLSLILLNLLVTLMVYVPSYENRDSSLYLSVQGLYLDNIYRYWDGPLYMIVAKTFYLPGSPELSTFSHLSPTYWVYLLNSIGILVLWNHGHRDLALFAGALYVPLIFVAHHDLVRYMLPIFPICMLIAFERLLSAKEFRLATLLIVPAIYIYTRSGVQTNLAPAGEMEQLQNLLGR